MNNTTTNSTTTTNNNKDDVSLHAKAKSDFATLLSASVSQAYDKLTLNDGVILEYEGETYPIAGVGENSYGLVLQVKITPKRTIPTFAPVPPSYSVVKIAPKNAARREHMHVTDYYKREVFMYEQVFRAFAELEATHFGDDIRAELRFNVVPHMYHYSLENSDEFIIFEDLQQQRYVQNARTNLPTFDLVTTALKAVAQLHAMSFVLQALRPEVYAQLVAQIKDNLFTADIEPISIEFGKSYVRRTREMLQQEKTKNKSQLKELSNVLNAVENQFKNISLKCVDGRACAPYAVICHGDFWNNNILYQYDSSSKKAISAKLIDFQMSRYASPVLDVVHYIFACTEKDLRDVHFNEFLDLYYTSLTEHLQLYRLDVATIFPRKVYEEHLKIYGVYGLIMSSFAIPFFISDNTEIPDLDEVSEAIQDLSSSSTSASSAENSDAEDENSEHLSRQLELIDKYDLLSERTLPIFKRRMTGIVADLVKYGMAERWLNYEETSSV